MIPHDPPRICTTCAVPHIKNCPDCWGFGVYKELSAEGETVPVSASAAIDGPLRREAIACPTCGGTVEGIGKKEMIAAIEQSWRARWKAIAKNYRRRLKNPIQRTNFCANCETTERRNVELQAELDAAQADVAAARLALRALIESDPVCVQYTDNELREAVESAVPIVRIQAKAMLDARVILDALDPGAPLLAKLAAARTQFATLHAAVQQVIFTMSSRDEDAAALERALTALEQVVGLNKESD